MPDSKPLILSVCRQSETRPCGFKHGDPLPDEPPIKEMVIYECERGHTVAIGDQPCYHPKVPGCQTALCMAPVHRITLREVSRERSSGEPVSPVYFDDEGVLRG